MISKQHHNDIELSLPEQVTTALEEVRAVLDDAFSTDDTRLDEIFSRTSSSFGKMLRSTLVLLFADLNGGISHSHITLSAAIEMMHSASLLHDDVIDFAFQRRGGDSCNSVFGSRNAILMGDLLVSNAFMLAENVADKKIFHNFFQAMATMSKAELLQNSNLNNYSLNIDAYYEIIKGKTAVLFSNSCMTGTIEWPGDVDKQAVADFGRNFGIAYQLINDHNNIFEKINHRPDTFSDIKNGNFTLPIIHCLSSDFAPELIGALEMKRYTAVPDILRRSGSEQYSIAEIYKYRQEALSCLQSIAASGAKNTIIKMVLSTLVV